MDFLNKLKVARTEKYEISKKVSELTKSYYSNKYKEMLQKQKIKEIECGILENNIYATIINIYNNKVRPIILQKYANKNIGEKRKEEINKIFEDILKEENIASYIHLSLGDYNWSFGDFYVTIYENQKDKEEYKDLYRFNFALDTIENELVPIYVNMEKLKIIDDADYDAVDLFNAKLEYTRTIKKHLDSIEEEKESYNRYIEDYNYNALINYLDLKCTIYNALGDIDYLYLI